MIVNKRRKFLAVVSALIIITVCIPIMSDSSQIEIANNVVLDAWCEKAWNDMITLKEDRYTDARLIGNMNRGAC